MIQGSLSKKGLLFQITICKIFSRHTHDKIKGIIKKLFKNDEFISHIFVRYRED